MVTESTRQLANTIRNSISKNGINHSDLSDLLDIATHAIENEDDVKWALKVTWYVKSCCNTAICSNVEILQMDSLYWKTLKTEAPHLFESFLYYMEKNRRPNKKFYKPRERTLHVVVQDLQDLEDGLLDFLGISLPPRVGKSTLCIFFLAWIIGKRPSSHNAMSGHSGILADRFYSDVFKLTENEEYTFHEIFPGVKKPATSSDRNELKYDPVESFATLTCRGVDGTWTGAVDISADGYLYVDDMVRDRTESLSPRRLEGRYQDYLNILVDRKNDGSRELMVGTRWNILDPLGKVESENKNNQRYRFRKIPALNEHGETNFDYDFGLGFSTQYYEEMKSRLDKNEWEAKYQQRPFVREGLLFPEDELKKFNGILPGDGLIQVASACDCAWGGNDSLSMPVGYQYEDGTVYIVDWIFMCAAKEYTVPKVCGMIMKHKIQKINFEADNGGQMYAKYVEDKLGEYGYKCSITSTKAPNTMAKLAKIQQYSDDIKKNFCFLNQESSSKEYRTAIDELTMFVQIGKNTHDDAPDSLSQLEAFLEGGFMGKVTATRNPFS